VSTRSITTVRSKWTDGEENEPYEWEIYATIYVHVDGYLSGVGKWLYDFLNGLVVVNGIRVDGNMPGRYANGPGRMAAHLVTAMQMGGMNPNLVPYESTMGQEYHYQINVVYGRTGGSVSITVFDGPMTLFGDGGDECTNLIFTGSVMEFGMFLDKCEEEEEEEE